MGKSNIVEIKNLNKIIKNKVILNNINLNLEEGKIYGIIGKNGCGKTMLFKTICGLVRPTEGEVNVLGKKIHNGELPKDTGVIIETPGFLANYSAFDNLKILASINNIISNETIKNCIALLGLDPEDKKTVKNFSLGMKQRLGIAQAIMEKPRFLILDEPMNALDKEGVQLVRNVLLKLKEEKITILIASHNDEDIKVLCDYVYTMVDGNLLNEV